MRFVRFSHLLLYVVRWLDLNTRPLLQPVRNPLRIRAVRNWLGNPITGFASLMIDASVVSVAGVHSDGDWYDLAGPAFRVAAAVGADESPHDIRVVVLLTLLLIDVMKLEVEIVLF